MKVAFKKQPKQKGVSLWWYLFIVISTTLVLSFTKPQEKKYPVSFTQSQWVQHSKWIDIAKNALTKSDLPAKDVSMINDSLSAFQNELGKQLVPLFQAENKNEKPKQDTTKTKQ